MGIFDSNEVCFDLLHFLSGGRSSKNLMVSVGVFLMVLSMTGIASFCTLSMTSRFVYKCHSVFLVQDENLWGFGYRSFSAQAPLVGNNLPTHI